LIVVDMRVQIDARKLLHMVRAALVLWLLGRRMHLRGRIAIGEAVVGLRVIVRHGAADEPGALRVS